jgi:hypothetical protein
MVPLQPLAFSLRPFLENDPDDRWKTRTSEEPNAQICLPSEPAKYTPFSSFCHPPAPELHSCLGWVRCFSTFSLSWSQLLLADANHRDRRPIPDAWGPGPADPDIPVSFVWANGSAWSIKPRNADFIKTRTGPEDVLCISCSCAPAAAGLRPSRTLFERPWAHPSRSVKKNVKTGTHLFPAPAREPSQGQNPL